MNATIRINNGIFSMYAIDATNPPSAREPVSPINTLAGYTLYTRNPNKLPIAAQEIGARPDPVPIATTVKNVAINAVTEEARPSRPSVKFAPFTVPSTTKNNKTI